MMLADAKRIHTDLVRMLDLLDQLPQSVGWIDRAAGLIKCGGEAVNADFHGASSRSATIRYLDIAGQQLDTPHVKSPSGRKL